MKRSTETQLVRTILDYLKALGILAWRNNTTGVFDPARKVLRSFTGRKGVSDILGVIPGDKFRPAKSHGVFLAVEVKSAKGRATPEQAEFLHDVRRVGGLGVLARCMDDLRTKLAFEGVEVL